MPHHDTSCKVCRTCFKPGVVSIGLVLAVPSLPLKWDHVQICLCGRTYTYFVWEVFSCVDELFSTCLHKYLQLLQQTLDSKSLQSPIHPTDLHSEDQTTSTSSRHIRFSKFISSRTSTRNEMKCGAVVSKDFPAKRDPREFKLEGPSKKVRISTQRVTQQ